MKSFFHSCSLRFWLFAMLAVVAVCLAYSNHFHNDFHFDDSHTIYNNMYIREIKNIPRFFRDATTTSSFPPNQAYRPGLTTLNTIDYWIMRQFHKDQLMPSPGFYHLSIFISFLFLGFLLFLMVKAILDRSLKNEGNNFVSLFVVSLFWLHTANAETINYIIARSDSFSTMMIVLAFVTYIYKPKWRPFFICLIPMAAGFFVKEPALIFIPLLFLYIVFFEKGFSIPDLFKKANFKKIYKNTEVLVVGLLIAVVLYILSRKLTPPTWISGGQSTFWYLVTEPYVILHYFKNFFYPNDLSADTDWKQLTTLANWRFFAGMLFIFSMLFVAYKTSLKPESRPVAFGILWFFLALLPTSSIIPFSEVLNDHRTFFPYIGLCIAFANAAYLIVLKYKDRFISNPVNQGLLLSAIVLFLAGHAYGTYQRNSIWKSELSLWKDVSIKSPENGRGLMNYGLALMGEKKFTEAEDYFKKGIHYLPDYAYLYINMGMVKSNLKDTAEAERNFKKAIQLGFNTPDPFYFYAQYLCGRKRFDEAIPLLKQALKLSKGHIYSRYVLLNVYADKYMWDDLDNLVAESVSQFPNDPEVLKYVDIAKNRKTITEREKEKVKTSKSPQSFIDLSLAYFNEGKYAECVEACKEVLKLDSTNADAYNNISCSYNYLGEWDLAEKYAGLAVKYRPGFEVAERNYKNIKERNESVYRSAAMAKANPSPENFLAVSTMFYNGLRYPVCIEYAKKAIQLRPNFAEAYTNIGAAYSRMKNWPEAEKACREALKINPGLEAAKVTLKFIQQQKGTAKL